MNNYCYICNDKTNDYHRSRNIANLFSAKPVFRCVVARIAGFLFTMSYRKKYKDYFNIQFGNEYDVHHIDFNHYNDSIDNLLLIPKELHQRLHKAKTNYGAFVDNQKNVFSDIKNQVSCNILSKAMREIADIYSELERWVYMKENEQKGILHDSYNYKYFRK